MNVKKFLQDWEQYIKVNGREIYKIAAAYKDGDAQSVEIRPMNRCMDGYSVTKAFTMTGIGMLVDRGLMSVDQTMAEFFPEEVANAKDARWAKVTPHMLMKHTQGLDMKYMDIDTYSIYDHGGRDFLNYLLSCPLAFEPGQERMYNDGGYYILSRIFSRVSGEKLDDFLWRELLYPLQFQEAAFSKCPMGYPIGGSGMYSDSRDNVKLGQLYLNGGVYKGQRIISQEWAKAAVENGYELRTQGNGVYGKGGMYGQAVNFVPSKNFAFAWHGFATKPHRDDMVDWILNWRE